jgi:hypothetical protein
MYIEYFYHINILITLSFHPPPSLIASQTIHVIFKVQIPYMREWEIFIFLSVYYLTLHGGLQFDFFFIYGLILLHSVCVCMCVCVFLCPFIYWWAPLNIATINMGVQVSLLYDELHSATQ